MESLQKKLISKYLEKYDIKFEENILIFKKEKIKISDTWKETQRSINKVLYRNHSLICGNCFKQYNKSCMVDCPGCKRKYCGKCYVQSFRTGMGIVSCPYCPHTFGKKMKDSLSVEIGIANIEEKFF